jgi:uncharacterized RDD family membrane protein YckC/uncharacterized membrane protein SpoIIM required for sporulation
MTTPPLERRVEIETPEQTILSYTVAGVGSRAAAALVDHLIIVGVVVTFALMGGALGSAFGARGVGGSKSAGAWAIALMSLVTFAVAWGYFVVFEAIWDGQTPGKRWLGIRVVQDGGYSVSFGASAARNLLRIVDMQPGFIYGAGLLSVAISKSGKRLGDIVAGTFVVQERLAIVTPAVVRPAEGQGAAAVTSRLTEEEYALLEHYVARRAQLDPERRAAFAAQLAARFHQHLGDTGSTSSAQLLRLHENERDARARGLPSRGATGAARERHSIVARNAARWSDFSTALAGAQLRGLRAMAPEEVSHLVSLYREVATDLARLRTASDGQDQGAIFYVSRLVGAGHNFLYRQRAVAPRDAWRYVTIAVPREVRRSAPYILAAALFFFGPMAVTFGAVLRHPGLESRLLPALMIDRVTDGVRRDSAGNHEYIATKDFERPVLASRIITNNVQVTYGVFAFGILAGIITVIMLVINGVSIGAGFGAYATHGIFHQIRDFVVAHSVLELSAICIAAGGGLLLAAALLLPGARTRREAFVLNGRRALRLLVASTLMLLAAGTIEGLISPRVDIPFTVKAGVAAATALLLAFWFSRGRGAVDEPAGELFAYSDPRALSSR